MKERMHYILLLLAILLIAGLSLANMQSVTVSFILFRFKIPLILLILLSVLLGAITTILISMPKNFSLKNELAKAKKELKTKNQVGIQPSFLKIFLKSSDFTFGHVFFCQNPLVRKSDDIIFSKKLCPKQECSEFAPKTSFRKLDKAIFL